MLRITQQDSAKDAKRYYATADYYSEGQEIVGSWGGKAARMLGLEGVVDKESFDRLCDNLDPRDGKPLTVRTRSDRTVGYDFTFSVPKSVSLLYAMTGDQEILDAFRSAVDETMRDIESEMKTRVRKGGKDADRDTGNMVWAEFIHTTSRPVDGVPDPQSARPLLCVQLDLGRAGAALEGRPVPRPETRCPVFPGGIPRAAGEQAARPRLRHRTQAR